jgi:hypothetical protein
MNSSVWLSLYFITTVTTFDCSFIFEFMSVHCITAYHNICFRFEYAVMKSGLSSTSIGFCSSAHLRSLDA